MSHKYTMHCIFMAVRIPCAMKNSYWVMRQKNTGKQITMRQKPKQTARKPKSHIKCDTYKQSTVKQQTNTHKRKYWIKRWQSSNYHVTKSPTIKRNAVYEPEKKLLKMSIFSHFLKYSKHWIFASRSLFRYFFLPELSAFWGVLDSLWYQFI